MKKPEWLELPEGVSFRGSVAHPVTAWEITRMIPHYVIGVGDREAEVPTADETGTPRMLQQIQADVTAAARDLLAPPPAPEPEPEPEPAPEPEPEPEPPTP
jgi:hypothetical protein